MTRGRGHGVAVGLARAVRDPALWLFAAMVLLGVLQTVVLEVGTTPLRAAAAPAAGACAVLVGRLLAVPEDPGRRHRWLQGLAAGQVLLGLWTLQGFLRALPGGIGEPSGFYVVKLQVTTPLGDHNTAAGFLLVGVVATVVLAHDRPRWWAGVAVTTLGFVACLSRGAAVVLLLVAVVSWFVGTRRRVAAALTLVAALAFAAVTLAAVVLDASPPAGADVPEGPIGTSIIGRIDLAARGLEVFAADPLLGVGLGGFAAEATDLPLPNDHAHNAVAHAAAEGGVPLVVLSIGVVLLLAWRAWRRRPADAAREVALLGGGALVLHAQVDVLGGLLGTDLLLAVLATLVAPASPGRPSPEEPRASV